MASAVALKNPKYVSTTRRARRPKTVDEYLNYDPRDGFKYEWSIVSAESVIEGFALPAKDIFKKP